MQKSHNNHKVLFIMEFTNQHPQNQVTESAPFGNRTLEQLPSSTQNAFNGLSFGTTPLSLQSSPNSAITTTHLNSTFGNFGRTPVQQNSSSGSNFGNFSTFGRTPAQPVNQSAPTQPVFHFGPSDNSASERDQSTSSVPRPLSYGQFIGAAQSGTYFRDTQPQQPQQPQHQQQQHQHQHTVSKLPENLDADIELDTDNAEYLIAYMNSSVLQYILQVVFTDAGVNFNAIKLSSNELYTNFIPANKFSSVAMHEFMNAVRTREHLYIIKHRNFPTTDTEKFGDIMPEGSGRRAGKQRCITWYVENNFPYEVDVQKSIYINCMGNGFQILTALHLSKSEKLKSDLYNTYLTSQSDVRTHTVNV
jgi:hypothetical protein